jgi:SAM-dependent methyltransferase
MNTKRFALLSMLLLWVVLPAWAQSQALDVKPALKPAVKKDVPYVPTPQNVVDRMLEMAEVGEDDIVYDLGCGDGRIVVSAARDRGARGVGIDIDPQRIEESRENARNAGVTDKVEFRVQDLFETDFSEATVLTLYLLPAINLELRPKILSELRPGTRVVSHDFDMGDWKPDQSEVMEYDAIFFWVVPANVSGTWSIEGVGDPLRITLTQEFQEVRGMVSDGMGERPLKDIQLRGDQIEFTVDRVVDGKLATVTFSGQVAGEQMAGGTAKGEAWSAERETGTRRPLDGKDEGGVLVPGGAVFLTA